MLAGAKQNVFSAGCKVCYKTIEILDMPKRWQEVPQTRKECRHSKMLVQDSDETSKAPYSMS